MPRICVEFLGTRAWDRLTAIHKPATIIEVSRVPCVEEYIALGDESTWRVNAVFHHDLSLLPATVGIAAIVRVV